MAGVATNWENLSIYYANLSPVYLCSTLFTILALFFTWWFSKNVSNESDSKSRVDGCNPTKKTNESKPATEGTAENVAWRVKEEEAEASEKFSSDESMMRHIKTARQSAIEKRLTAGLSAEQLIKERETQASQLTAIYNLLRDKEDQFQIRSMDELQEQLKLYKS